jgi:hypothetical protein
VHGSPSGATAPAHCDASPGSATQDRFASAAPAFAHPSPQLWARDHSPTQCPLRSSRTANRTHHISRFLAVLFRRSGSERNPRRRGSSKLPMTSGRNRERTGSGRRVIGSTNRSGLNRIVNMVSEFFLFRRNELTQFQCWLCGPPATR